MIPFAYHRPASIEAAIALAGGREGAAFIAGGHSLVPAMKAGRNAVKALIDLAGIPSLRGIRVFGDHLVVGAMTRHDDLAGTARLDALAPALSQAPASIGDPHVRLAGTIGGSLAANLPGADLPAACLALGATIRTDRRRIDADAFFAVPGRTALEVGELICEVIVPVAPRSYYVKIEHPASGLALAAACVVERGGELRIAVAGISSGPLRAVELEKQIRDGTAPAAMRPEFGPIEQPLADSAGSSAYRQHLATVLAGRAIEAIRGGSHA